MRHSFLPANEQKTLKRMYRIHAGIVGLFLLSAAGLIGAGSLFPAYVLVSAERRTQLGTVATIRKDKDERGIAAIEDKLKTDSILVNALSGEVETAKPSSVVSIIASARGPVKISSLSIDNISTTTATLTIQGISPTREALVSFKNRVETLSKGSRADLPISELAKSKDIAFSMRISLSLP